MSTAFKKTRSRRWSRRAWCAVLAIVALVSVVFNMNIHAPPRFDGAGYAMLGQALATGRGYREISHPDAPRHAHFPPGYPAALAVLWTYTGRSIVVAHVFSAVCTVAAIVLTGRWFLGIVPRAAAWPLALALAVNWAWGRMGGSIQSEPLFVFGQSLALLLAWKAGRRGGVANGMVLGAVLGACVLVRHVGACLAAALLIDLAWKRRWKTAGAAGLAAALVVLPWIAWLALVGRNTQVGLLKGTGLGMLILNQSRFYLERLPDSMVGPFVEVGTVFRRSRAVAILADFWAVAATGAIVSGWLGLLCSPRRRLAALVPFATLALLLVWPFTEAGRFLAPLAPFVLLGAAEGLTRGLARFGVSRRRARAFAARALLAASVPYAAYAIAAGRAEALRHTHANFDAACRWIREKADRPGPIVAERAGEVFWQTGRQAIGGGPADVETIDRWIGAQEPAYILVEAGRYANAPAGPLAAYVRRRPDRAALIWGREHNGRLVQLWEVRRVREPGE